MKKVSTYNTVVFIAPLVALGVGGLLYLGQKTRLTHLKAEYDDTQNQIAKVKAQLQQADKDFVLKRHPSEVQSKAEQGAFLNTLRQYAFETGAEITRWANASAPASGSATTPPPAPANGATGGKLPADTLPIVSSIDVRGEYAKVRAFLYKLQLSPRLMTVQQARWVREQKYPFTMASFSLVRYVRTPSEVEKQSEEKSGTPTPPTPASGTTILPAASNTLTPASGLKSLSAPKTLTPANGLKSPALNAPASRIEGTKP